jgi:hypothetical protein
MGRRAIEHPGSGPLCLIWRVPTRAPSRSLRVGRTYDLPCDEPSRPFPHPSLRGHLAKTCVLVLPLASEPTNQRERTKSSFLRAVLFPDQCHWWAESRCFRMFGFTTRSRNSRHTHYFSLRRFLRTLISWRSWQTCPLTPNVYDSCFRFILLGQLCLSLSLFSFSCPPYPLTYKKKQTYLLFFQKKKKKKKKS